ncbi:MAG TPA: glycoside hydrolase family 38 C-terminal domain-containing protein [Ilumatobacter sp.]|nr:glycoside hydrolase family 38 C-terminal domain-containing protein [Ilumatobacter sp.]
MHRDRGLLEERITRELWERVLPLVESECSPLSITAGPTRDDQTPFEVGAMWGAPWTTTWFTFHGTVPEGWAHRRVEAVIDLGFRGDPAGFQCEGLIVDDAGHPVQGIHPRRTNHRIDARPGPITIRLEAASNPSFRQFRPSPLGDPETAGSRPLYRFRDAHLVLVDDEAEALVHDLDVVDGVMRSLHLDDPRRARLLTLLGEALDRLPDIRSMRSVVAPVLAAPSAASSHHIVATGHAHIDTAWLWPTRETVRKCTRTFASAVRLMDEHPEYRFSCSQAQQYAWIEDHHPDLFERITAKVHGGQWIPVGGMWVEADMNLPSGESLVRQIVHGQRYFESRFGRRCAEVWIPDVFGYPASMPQLYAAGGMHRLVTQKLSWNTTNRFPHHTFWWEGLDGTHVLTHFPPVDTYNAELTPAECSRSAERFLDAGWSSWSLMPFGYGDGGGGPTREMLERASRMADLDGAPRVTVGSPAEFFDHVEREHRAGATVPVWRGELYFETHRGTLTSQLRTKVGNRRCERLLREVELWSATAGLAADVDRLWRDVLTQQFHDIIPGSSIAWVHRDAEDVHDTVITALEERLADLFEALVPPGPHVVNAAGVDRDEIVEVDGTARRVQVSAHGIAPAGDVRAEDHVVVSDWSMSNGHLAVRWDETGAITSIIDLARAREIVPVGARTGVLELAPDRPVRYDAWDLESWTPGMAEPVTRPEAVEVVSVGPLVGAVRATYRFGPSAATVTHRLTAGSRRLDIEVEIEWEHDEHLLSMSFPLDVRADTAACDIQFGHVRRPTHPSTSWDAAKFEVCAHRYVDVSEPSFGVAVLNDGRYGHGLFGGRVRASLARAARYPDPGADRGRHVTRFALFPHGAGLAEVVAEAERFNVPLRVVEGRATGAVPTPIVDLIGRGVEIDAVKPADDDPRDLIVRFHEAVGDRSAVTIRCDRPIVAASRCNLLEEPGPGLEVGDGIAVVTARPFEIATLRLTRS